MKETAGVQGTVKYAKLKFSKGPLEKPAQAIFVPPDKSMTVEKAIEATRRWGLEPPNLLVTVDIGTRYPSSLATGLLVKAMNNQGVPEVEQLLRDMRAGVQQRLTASGISPQEQEALLDEKVVDGLSAVLFYKLSQVVV